MAASEDGGSSSMAAEIRVSRKPTIIGKLIAHPLARGVDLDDPRATVLRRQILADKKFLRKIYEEWYAAVVADLPSTDGPVLELGSGAGFLKEALPEVITSDIMQLPGLSLVLDATSIPLRSKVLRSIVMIDVLHHIPQPRRFFKEATHCVKPGGRIIMIEPWMTPWSKFVYTRLHDEPCLPDASEWEFPSTGPLSGANEALPWILFDRDHSRFRSEFPLWKIVYIRPDMPFSYLLSGGVSLRIGLPGSTFAAVRWFEKSLGSWARKMAMFAKIVLERLP